MASTILRGLDRIEMIITEVRLFFSRMGANDDKSVTLHIENQGNGQPIIFLHGAWLSSAMWHPQINYLAPDYRVITVDIRGHGQSEAGGTPYSVPQFATDLEEVVDRLGVEAPFICGNSLGGLIAMTYAETDPVRGLILADTVRSIPPFPVSEWYTRTIFPKATIYPALRALGSGGTFRWLLNSIEGTLGRPWLATEPATRSYALQEVDSMRDASFVNIFDALYEYTAPDLNGVDTPSLVIFGDHEAPPVKAQSRMLARELDTEVTSISDSGHLVNLDNPVEFNSTIHEFIATRTKTAN